jgi:hypothetical protein
MAVTTQEISLFWRRTRDLFHALKREARAAGACPSYSLEDLRTLAEKQLARSVCSYCRGPVTVATMALAHKTPIARGGRFTLRNLEVCCPDCQRLRGVLDAQEYRELRLLIATWPRPVQKRFLAGLKTVQELAHQRLDQDDSVPHQDPSTLLSGVTCHEVSHG